GSYGIIHHASSLIALMVEQGEAGSMESKMWARVLKERDNGPSNEAFPFEWRVHTGRFHALDPESLQEQQRGTSSAPVVDHMTGYPEIGTVLVTIPFGDDANRLALKSVGATFDRTSKAWAVDASRARLTVEAARLPWKRPPPLAVAQVLP